MIRVFVFCAATVLALGVSSSAMAQAQAECDTSPWIVTGTDVPGGVLVNVCGLWIGCLPHDPQVSVSGDQVGITFTAAPPDACHCPVVQTPFNRNVFVPSLPPGTFTVTVTVEDCGFPNVVGTGTIVSGADGAVLVAYGAGVAGAWTTELTLTNITGEESSIGMSDRLVVPCVPGASCASFVTLLPRGTVVATYPLPGIGSAVGAAYIFPGHGPAPSVLARAVSPGTACATVDLPVFSVRTLRARNVPQLTFAGARRGSVGRSNLLLANVPDPTTSGTGPSLEVAIEAYSADGVLLGETVTTVEYGRTVFVTDILGVLGVSEVENAQLRVTKVGGDGVMWGIMPISRSDGSFSMSVGAVP